MRRPSASRTVPVSWRSPPALTSTAAWRGLAKRKAAAAGRPGAPSATPPGRSRPTRTSRRGAAAAGVPPTPTRPCRCSARTNRRLARCATAWAWATSPPACFAGRPPGLRPAGRRRDRLRAAGQHFRHRLRIGCGNMAVRLDTPFAIADRVPRNPGRRAPGDLVRDRPRQCGRSTRCWTTMTPGARPTWAPTGQKAAAQLGTVGYTTWRRGRLRLDRRAFRQSRGLGHSSATRYLKAAGGKRHARAARRGARSGAATSAAMEADATPMPPGMGDGAGALDRW